MNLNTIPLAALDRLARLHRTPEFPMLLSLLRADLADVIQEAIKTADPRLCGAAQALQGTIEILEAIPAAFDARKANDFPPANTPNLNKDSL